MEVTSRTTDQLGKYLQQVVAFTDPGLMVRSEMDVASSIVLTVLREVPARGVSLVLTQGFLQHNQDAQVLQVIRDCVFYWQSVGLPMLQEEHFHREYITVESHGSS
ncbi:hypothetical protein [Deinococcus cellulosilyticus]|uniref:Uncharacterized protein n=1 Tax=Deinococcus cellulosilyticus (strain DSM 18568 / NBRC 106333 / KACC 11606 / 5516J-15) TaxID=1223518 RepID=A0A511N0L9_DEIC1|nr:hypothetical protein [Deinococcus cellulosilyticus]GEM46359.1 hypothetical protein DC3_19940 [Deinococcus cellulosilyticus NBRC 106333 = KACC 11606]